MPISYKNKIYTTLGTPTNLSGNVVSATDSAGVPTKDYTVKGKTIVWNQMLDKSKYPTTATANGVTFTNNGDGTITVNGTATANAIFAPIGQANPTPIVSGHKFLFTSCPSGGSLSSYFSDLKKVPEDETFFDVGEGLIMTTTSTTTGLRFNIRVYSGYTANNLVFKPQLFDLTKMFGAGNEPATPEEFRAMFPDDYYPYNVGELKSIMPEAVETKNQSGETKRVNIPTLKYFPDGMKSIDSVYDEINFLSQKAIKRIGVQNDISTFPWVSGGSHWWGFRVSSVTGLSWKKFTKILCAKYEWKDAVTDATMSTDIPNGLYCSTGGEWINIKDSNYSTTAAFKSSIKDVSIYYELEAPVETAITPPLQSLSTYKGFTSFSATNSLIQNGPLSVTYYAEGGTNPEKGWLTSYKRKLYMGRTIEWNQLLDKSKFWTTTTTNGVTFTNNSDGTITVNGTAGSTANAAFNVEKNISVIQGHKYYATMSKPIEHANFWLGLYANSGDAPFPGGTILDRNGKIVDCVRSSDVNYSINLYKNASVSNATVKPQLFDLTQMFGAGNEPATPEEFWSYFDHKIYPYNAGETQPLFKISRKSQWGSVTVASLYVGEDIIIPQIVRN